ncbi:MAG TPA: ribosome biogenesis GTPase YlqF [Bacillota bacterium]|nr:ribosome biogenesis GTPase YlqF [Bacillota bacterium]
MTIQWFPGHMTKARREVESSLKLVDFVIELVDARVPLSSQNPMLQEIIQNKPKLTVLMKNDLADPQETEKWLTYFKRESLDVLAINANQDRDIKQLIQRVKEKGEEHRSGWQKKVDHQRALRVMIIGVPNVGKSTLINRLANKKIANIGDRPGITKHQAWIKVGSDFQLLDTPGILWPKFDDQLVGYRLASIGTIKDRVLPLQDIAAFAINYLLENYPDSLDERYSLDTTMEDMWDIFVHIGKNRGALESGGTVNFDQVANLVLRDLRTGKLGKITLEKV